MLQGIDISDIGEFYIISHDFVAFKGGEIENAHLGKQPLRIDSKRLIRLSIEDKNIFIGIVLQI